MTLQQCHNAGAEGTEMQQSSTVPKAHKTGFNKTSIHVLIKMDWKTKYAGLSLNLHTSVLPTFAFTQRKSVLLISNMIIDP